MTDKPRIKPSEIPWFAAYSRIEEGKKYTADGIEYEVSWKHENPPWLQLRFRVKGKVEHRMCRKGDPLMLDLRQA